MIVLVKQFQPDITDPVLQVPAGAQCVEMRLSPIGPCEAVFVADEGVTDVVDVQALILFEDQGNVGGGALAGWKHVGTWRYASGRIAHGFVKAPVLDKPRTQR